jgi:hypothetical protein
MHRRLWPRFLLTSMAMKIVLRPPLAVLVLPLVEIALLLSLD